MGSLGCTEETELEVPSINGHHRRRRRCAGARLRQRDHDASGDQEVSMRLKLGLASVAAQVGICG